MRLIIFGPPGSGKGTYSSILKEKLGIEKISTGDIFRAEVKKQSELGKKVESYLKQGLLVPDEIVIEVVKKIIDEKKDNFILDGFPRTVNQAEWLINYIKIDAIIKINVHDEILIEKISGRRVCSNPNCDGNYNITDIDKVIDGIHYKLPSLLPKNDMICDKCGSKLIQRDDDRPEIVRERLKVYYQQTKPVEEYLRKKGLYFVEIWANREPKFIAEEIISKLSNR
ncbi:MAG: nucleoside monophosphate kinase [Candidatus Aenigmatarchaeota archaeon]|nr:nucleoside monophosphate kinase [Candidatus Aenigmarchaeota archaeon]